VLNVEEGEGENMTMKLFWLDSYIRIEYMSMDEKRMIG
jgi:hypothetical protein